MQKTTLHSWEVTLKASCILKINTSEHVKFDSHGNITVITKTPELPTTEHIVAIFKEVIASKYRSYSIISGQLQYYKDIISLDGVRALYTTPLVIKTVFIDINK